MSAATHSLTPAISLRNTAWLAIALALVAAPHAERLPVWLSALAAAACMWRLYLARMRLALPARWLLIFVVTSGAAAIFLEYRTLFGRDAGVALLVLMISLSIGNQLVPAGDRLIVETPGSGGIGEPRERSRKGVAQDVKYGLVSSEQARVLYGFKG